MFRREAIFGEKFDPEFPVAEDYDIYLRILDKGWLCTNLNTALTFYRIHGQNITLTKKQLLHEKDIQLLKRQLDKLALKYTDEELRYYFLLGKIDVAEYYIEYLRYNFYDVNELLNKIVFANINSGFLNNNTLIVFLFKYWNDSFVAIISYSYSLYGKIKKSPFYDKLSLVRKVKFRVKCLINYKSTYVF
jgi:hypothetical protein